MYIIYTRNLHKLSNERQKKYFFRKYRRIESEGTVWKVWKWSCWGLLPK